MALFRRFFNRRPSDQLLEISERVYVFDCCFSTEALEEDEYKVYMGGIVAELQDHDPDSSFMVFNFRDGDRRTHISDILSQYDMTVMEYPRQYERCPMLPLEMINHFLRSCESWLSLEGQQNVLLLHCERGGWPVLAFMLAALLLFRKQYVGEQKTLEMVYKHASREHLHLLTPLNPQPSQLRYLQYISRRKLGSDWPPSATPLALDGIILRFLPLFDEKGCRPVIRIYGRDSDSNSTTANRGSKLLFTSKKPARYYRPEECEWVKIDIHQRVQGDVVIECIHLEHVREEMVFRVMFHTTFVRNNELILSRDEVDVMWDARDQMPKNFKAEVYFSDAEALASMITTEEEFENDNETKGSKDEDVFEVEEIFSRLLDGQDGLLPNEIKVDAENVDIVLKEESEPEINAFDVPATPHLPPRYDAPPPPSPPPPPPPTYAVPFPQIVAPFLKEFGHLKIQLEDIKSVTDNFGENKVIGRGGFGTVYLGEVSHSKGKCMGAFKRLDPRHGQGDPEFWKEILMLSGYKHENLISLLGFCDEDGERILVYEYASNGSLDRHLSSTHLTWIQRIKICLDAARGLSFLHDDKGTMQRVIHRDIKSSNILLDGNWNAKVSDMGLSKIGPANQPHTFLITRNIVGTPGYCDPQYMNSYTLSKESDVYSFGVVLFEVLCGRLCCNYSKGRLHILVPTWKKAYKQKKLHEIVFQDLMRPMDSTSLETFSGIAFQCLQKSREERPTIAHVVEKLETALKFQKPPNKYEDGRKVEVNRVRPAPPPPPPPPIRRAPPYLLPPPPPPPPPPPLRRQLAPPPPLPPKKDTSKGKGPERGKAQLWSKNPDVLPSFLGELQSGEPQSAEDFDVSELKTLFAARVSEKRTSKVHLIDLRRANNTEIMLTKVKMPIPDMMAAALAMDESILDADQIEILIKFCPTKDEKELLKYYTGEKERLGKCEQFFLELMKVPRMESKLRVFLFKILFNTKLSELKESLNTVNNACDEVQNSVKLKEIMKRIFHLWNTLNQGANRGSAVGFKLDNLLKLSDTWASNSKMTLMHYLCKVLASKSPDLLDFHVDLVSLESATKIQLKSLAEEMQAFIKGLEKVKQELVASANDGPVSQVFHKTLNEFAGIAESEVASVTNLYSVVGRNADALALYFGEDPARYPFERVTMTLLKFVRLFQKAQEENYKVVELEEKKVQKEADMEKTKGVDLTKKGRK